MTDNPANRIDAHVDFSFKGESYDFQATLDLDELMERHGALPPIHAVLAGKHGIDTYSYLYEVMLEEDIHFTHATGLAADFLQDGLFDTEAFSARWRDERVLQRLQATVTRELGIDPLARHPALGAILLHAYHMGRADCA